MLNFFWFYRLRSLFRRYRPYYFYRGCTGHYVKEINKYLCDLGYLPLFKRLGKPSERFDVWTEHAVKDFQYDKKLPTSGIVNKNLYDTLEMLAEELKKE